MLFLSINRYVLTDYLITVQVSMYSEIRSHKKLNRYMVQ